MPEIFECLVNGSLRDRTGNYTSITTDLGGGGFIRGDSGWEFKCDNTAVKTGVLLDTSKSNLICGWSCAYFKGTRMFFASYDSANRLYVGTLGTGLLFGVGDTHETSGSINIPANAMFHWALLIDGAEAVFYINKIEKKRFNYSGGAIQAHDNYIGAANDAGSGIKWSHRGAIRNVNIYTGDEASVQQLENHYAKTVNLKVGKIPNRVHYREPVQLVKPNLVAAWNLSPETQPIQDISGNGNNSTSVSIGISNKRFLKGAGAKFNGLSSRERILIDPLPVPLSSFSIMFVANIFNEDSIGLFDVNRADGIRVYSRYIGGILSLSIRLMKTNLSYVSYLLCDIDEEKKTIPFGIDYDADADALYMYKNGLLCKTIGSVGGINSLDGAISIGYAEYYTQSSNNSLQHMRVFNEIQSASEHESFAREYNHLTIFRSDFSNDRADGAAGPPEKWAITSGAFKMTEDVDGKYLECTSDGVVSFPFIDLSESEENGYIMTLRGDLSSDEGLTVDSAANVSFADNTLNFTMTAGQKLREVNIIRHI